MTGKISAQSRIVNLSREDMAIWTWLVSRGITHSLSGLSTLTGRQISTSSLNIMQIHVKDMINLLGKPESIIVSTHLLINGDAAGEILLAHDRQSACEIIDRHMNLPAGTTREFGEMAVSILGEMANVTGAFFLNILSDATGLRLTPSPPDVMVGRAENVMRSQLGQLAGEQQVILTVRAVFGTKPDKPCGVFLVLPTERLVRLVLKNARTQGNTENNKPG